MQIELQDSRDELFSCPFFLQPFPAPACTCLLPVPRMCTANTPACCLRKVHRADPAVAPAILPCRRRALLAPQPVEHRRLPPGGLPRLPAGLRGEPCCELLCPAAISLLLTPLWLSLPVQQACCRGSFAPLCTCFMHSHLPVKYVGCTGPGQDGGGFGFQAPHNLTAGGCQVHTRLLRNAQRRAGAFQTSF